MGFTAGVLLCCHHQLCCGRPSFLSTVPLPHPEPHKHTAHNSIPYKRPGRALVQPTAAYCCFWCTQVASTPPPFTSPLPHSHTGCRHRGLPVLDYYLHEHALILIDCCVSACNLGRIVGCPGRALTSHDHSLIIVFSQFPCMSFYLYIFAPPK